MNVTVSIVVYEKQNNEMLPVPDGQNVIGENYWCKLTDVTTALKEAYKSGYAKGSYEWLQEGYDLHLRL